MSALQPVHPTPLDLRAGDVFDQLIAQVGRTVAQSSGRIYHQTYDAWRAWCEQNSISPLALWPADGWMPLVA